MIIAGSNEACGASVPCTIALGFTYFTRNKGVSESFLCGHQSPRVMLDARRQIDLSAVDNWFHGLRPRMHNDRVAPGRYRPGAPTEPYLHALAHTVPLIMVSLRT